MDCYEWIKQWGHDAGEMDPTAKDYDVVLDPFDKRAVYDEYNQHFKWTHLASSQLHACSYRQFVRLLLHWMKSDRVRIRSKKNITTKCDSKC